MSRENIKRGSLARLVQKDIEGVIFDLEQRALDRLVGYHHQGSLTDSMMRGIVGEIVAYRTLASRMEVEIRKEDRESAPEESRNRD